MSTTTHDGLHPLILAGPSREALTAMATDWERRVIMNVYQVVRLADGRYQLTGPGLKNVKPYAADARDRLEELAAMMNHAFAEGAMSRSGRRTDRHDRTEAR